MKIIDFNDSNYNIVDLVGFMNEISNDFYPPLIERLRLKSDVSSFKHYALKLTNNGIIKLCIFEDHLVGLIAFYANDFIYKTSFIPILIVKAKYRKQGIGKILLQECIDNVREIDLNAIEVETWESNISALKLYTSFGFKTLTEKETNIRLRLELKQI